MKNRGDVLIGLECWETLVLEHPNVGKLLVGADLTHALGLRLESGEGSGNCEDAKEGSLADSFLDSSTRGCTEACLCNMLSNGMLCEVGLAHLPQHFSLTQVHHAWVPSEDVKALDCSTRNACHI